MTERLRAVFTMKDPQEKKTGSGRNEPPDLDELWREFNRRCQRIFGRKQINRGSNSGKSEPKQTWYYSVIALCVALGVWLGSSFYTVHTGQAGVVLQFGEYKKTVRAGLHWRLPYPFESHEIVDLTIVRSVEIGRNKVIKAADVKDSSMLTKEGQIINVRFNVRYYVNDARAFLFNNVDPEMDLVQTAQAAAREVVGQRNMAELLANGREQLGEPMAQALQKILDACKSGIRINDVVLQSIQLPEQMQSVSEEVQKIRTANEDQKNAAQAYAKEIIPAAQNTATRMINEAESYKATVIAQAHGEVARFKPLLASFLKAPAATREHMYVNTMQQVYGNSTKIFIDGSKAASLQILLPSDGANERAQFTAAQKEANGGALQTKQGEAGRDRNAQSSDKFAPGAATSAVNASTAGAIHSGSVEPVPSNKWSLRERDFLRNRDRSEDVR